MCMCLCVCMYACVGVRLWACLHVCSHTEAFEEHKAAGKRNLLWKLKTYLLFNIMLLTATFPIRSAAGEPLRPGSTCWASPWSSDWRSRRTWAHDPSFCRRGTRKRCAGPACPRVWLGWRSRAWLVWGLLSGTRRSCQSERPSARLYASYSTPV